MRIGILFTWLVVAVLACSTAALAEPGVAVIAGDDDFSGMEMKGSYLGIDPGEVTSENAAALKMKEESGVEVKMVDQDAPAGKAGLKEHDVILSFNGQKIEGVDQLRRMLSETPGGRAVKLGISRNGQNMDVLVTLVAKKQMNAKKFKMMVPPVPPAMGAAPMIAPMSPMEFRDFDFPPNVNIVVQTTSRNGLMLESLTPQLAEFFGVKRGEGVLVRGVDRGSAAATAGLKAGDVIVSIDKEQVSDVSDWRRVIRNKTGTVSVGIIRDKRQQSVPMKVPERKTREQGSLVAPDDFDFNFDFDADDLRFELEKIRPELEKQKRLIAMQLEKQKPEIERQLREAQKVQKVELKKQMEQIKAELAKIDAEKIKQQTLTEMNKIDWQKMQQDIDKQMKELQKDLQQQQLKFEMISY